MQPTAQLRLAMLISLLCVAVIVVCLGQLLGSGSLLAPVPVNGGAADRDPALAMIEQLQAEVKALRAEQEALAAEKLRLSEAVVKQDRVIVTQKDALENLAEQLRLRPATP